MCPVYTEKTPPPPPFMLRTGIENLPAIFPSSADRALSSIETAVYNACPFRLVKGQFRARTQEKPENTPKPAKSEKQKSGQLPGSEAGIQRRLTIERAGVKVYGSGVSE